MSAKQINAYQARFKKYGISPQSLFWHNQKSISIRYQNLLQNLDLENKSILEIGSGFGDAIPFIQKKAQNFDYLGLDIVPEFVRVSQMHFPDYHFKAHDILKKPLRQKFDLVITSGAFNSNLKNNLACRKKVIKTLFNYSNEALAFNMAGSHPQPQNRGVNRVYYADSLEIFKFCTTLSPKLILNQSYLPKDFTITIFKTKK